MLNFYRFPDLESWLLEAWEGRFVANWDANDMLALLETWQRGDVARGESLEAALGSVGAEALVMPCRTDLYFCVRGFFCSSLHHRARARV